MGAGQEFTVAGMINNKQLGKYKSFNTQLKITEPSGTERVINQTYEVNLIYFKMYLGAVWYVHFQLYFKLQGLCIRY
jgi:hypothetical protein